MKDTSQFSLCEKVVDFPQLAHATRRIREVHEFSRLKKKGRGIALLGPSGVGKTTVLQDYMRSYSSVRSQPGSKPIVYVQVPSTPSPKSLGAAVLSAMGDRFSHRGSAEEKLSRIVLLLKGLNTELIIFDEAQHLVERRRTPTGATTDWLKNMLNESGVAVVMAGLKHTQSLLASNEQLRRRFSATIYYDRFDITKPSEAASFAKLLISFEGQIPVQGISFKSIDLITRFYFASFGLIDYLIKIVDRAVQLAKQSRNKEITQEILAEAFEDEVWSQASERRNPFSKSFDGAALIGKGEPFEDFDIKAM